VISGEEIIAEPESIRTDEGEFHVLTVLDSSEILNTTRGNKVNEFVNEHEPFHFDPKGFIEPDGSAEAGGFSSLAAADFTTSKVPLRNLAKHSRMPYAAKTENSTTLKEENETLKKQLNSLKDRLQSIESEYCMFQQGLNTIFGQDQISYIRRRANGESQPKGVKWRAETVASAAKMRLEFSDTTYKALLRMGFPFPSIEYMRNFAYKLEKASWQNPLETKWSEDNLMEESIKELEQSICYEDRIDAEKTTEHRNRYNYRAITSTNSHDDLLPNWFTKINLDARKTLLFPEGSGAPRGSNERSMHHPHPVVRGPGNTYANSYYKATHHHRATHVVRKVPAPKPLAEEAPETAAKLISPTPPLPLQAEESPKKVVKLVPCAPPDFIKNKKIKVTKIDGSKLKLATLQPKTKLPASLTSAGGQEFQLQQNSFAEDLVTIVTAQNIEGVDIDHSNYTEETSETMAASEEPDDENVVFINIKK